MLFDTSILVDFMRGRTEAVSLVKSAKSGAGLSVVTVAELFAGAKRHTEEREIRELVAELKVIVVSQTIAELAGNHVKHFAASHSLELPDALIAATAQQHGLALATLNVKHFPMFKRLRPAY